MSLFVSQEYLKAEDNVLLIDDFLGAHSCCGGELTSPRILVSLLCPTFLPHSFWYHHSSAHEPHRPSWRQAGGHRRPCGKEL